MATVKKQPAREVRDRGLIRALVRSGARSDQSPPVAKRRRALHEPTLCERCGAVYSHKTWRSGVLAVDTDPIGAFWTVCPACEQLATGEFFGRVLVAGPLALSRQAEIRRRIQGVVSRARFTQPQHRLVSFEQRDDVLEALTTSQKLAHRIGRELEKSFGGHTSFAWSDRDGELYAVWQSGEGPLPAVPPRRRRIRGRRRTAFDLEIQARGVTPDPAWRDLIEGAAARLAGRYPELMRLHVTLRHSGHHRHGQEQVAIVATVPGSTLRAEKGEEETTAALHAALRAVGQALEDYHRRRRRFVKSPGPRPQGTVHRVFADRGYGFVLLDRGEEVYFHRHALRELDFETLTPGLPVEVELEQGREGLQASGVFPVGERGRA